MASKTIASKRWMNSPLATRSSSRIRRSIADDLDQPQSPQHDVRNATCSSIPAANLDEPAVVELVVNDVQNKVNFRFSTFRIARLVSDLKDDQKEFVKNAGFSSLLDVKKFTVPLDFMEWIMKCTDPDRREIVVGNNRIPVTNSMVNTIIGLDPGKDRVQTSSKDTKTRNIVSKLRDTYIKGRGKGFSLPECCDLCKIEHDEVNFTRLFMLLTISSFFAPGKDNNCCMQYLHSLIDTTKIKEFDWADHILTIVFSEVKRYHDNVKSDQHSSTTYYGGFIQLLAIIYLDFVDLSSHSHPINYSLPRISNITKGDFQFLVHVDKQPNAQKSYGTLPIRNISDTPYAGLATQGHDAAAAIDFELPVHAPIADPHPTFDSNPCASSTGVDGLDDIDTATKAILDRANSLWYRDFKLAADSYSNTMSRLFKESLDASELFGRTVNDLHHKLVKDLTSQLRTRNSSDSRVNPPFDNNRDPSSQTNVPNNTNLATDADLLQNGENEDTPNRDGCYHSETYIRSSSIDIEQFESTSFPNDSSHQNATDMRDGVCTSDCSESNDYVGVGHSGLGTNGHQPMELFLFADSIVGGQTSHSALPNISIASSGNDNVIIDSVDKECSGVYNCSVDVNLCRELIVYSGPSCIFPSSKGQSQLNEDMDCYHGQDAVQNSCSANVERQYDAEQNSCSANIGISSDQPIINDGASSGRPLCTTQTLASFVSIDTLGNILRDTVVVNESNDHGDLNNETPKSLDNAGDFYKELLASPFGSIALRKRKLTFQGSCIGDEHVPATNSPNQSDSIFSPSFMDSLQLGPGLDFALNMEYAIDSPAAAFMPNPNASTTQKGFAEGQHNKTSNPVSMLHDETPPEKIPESQTFSPPIGTRTLDKMNRKLRKAMPTNADDSLTLEIPLEVDLFYSKLARNSVPATNSKSKPLPAFVKIGGFDVSYPEFYESVKRLGCVSEVVMSAYSAVFNDSIDPQHSGQFFRKRIAFSPSLAEKFLADPAAFESRTCLAELKRLQKSLTISDAHLLFFPLFLKDNQHWVLICINRLHKRFHYFDSSDSISKDEILMFSNNLVKNFSTCCVNASIWNSNLNYDHGVPIDYPKHKNYKDSGIYKICYMHLFDGESMKYFDKIYVDQQRKLLAHKLVNSRLNEVDSIALIKKPKVYSCKVKKTSK